MCECTHISALKVVLCNFDVLVCVRERDVWLI